MIVATHPGTGTKIVQGVLRQHGAQLHLVQDRETASELEFDALILLGGADISPFFYGEPPVYSDPANKDRDVIEWILTRRALTMGVPIMGICRGHQMLAVACGGALYQDIAIQTGKDHKNAHGLSEVSQPLSDYVPTRRVNSLHHQAVKVLPPGFKAAAFSDDGIVEAIWRPGMLGVQWHPELLYPQNKAWSKLFRWLVCGLH